MPVFVALLATISNFYNYAIFGLAANFLAEKFLPSSEFKLTYIFSALGFAVLIRPLASVIFGTVGDIYGRSIALKLTSIASISATLLICFIPSFEEIGYYAIAALITCRALMLASVTGQSDGARIYISEQLGSKYTNLANGLVSFNAQIGVLLASLAIFTFNKHGISLKFAFIIGAILNLVIIFLRSLITETEEFTQNKTQNDWKPFIQHHWKILTVAIFINGCTGGIYNFFIIYMSNHANNILTNTEILTTLSIGCYAVFACAAGYAADRWGFYHQSLVTLITSVIICFIAIVQIANNSYVNYPLILLQMALFPFYTIPMQIYLKTILPVNLRYRTFSMCHSLGSILISTPTPIIASFIWTKSDIKWLNFIYPVLLLVMLIFCLTFIKKNKFIQEQE